MKKTLLMGAAVCAVFAMTSCKSKESAYKKAYEKAKAQQEAVVTTTPVTTQTVTFTITTGSGQSATAVEGAVIDVDGARLKTNASGQAVFNLRAGTYGVKVKASGYKTVTDSVTVAASAVTKAVSLTANS